ncbi:MAG: BMP family ABC transporter substrate-binding protein [Lachnospiraceae bacterium]|nr:BMP family ABC transporter substrate-binding protein [Lachnospiraceae bacterium]
MQMTAIEEYNKARSLALKEKKEREARGLSPYPAVLDEVFPGASAAPAVSLGIREIPVDRIVGTATRARTNAFSASFLPLAEPNTEFAMKWTALCGAHLSDEGIREPVECAEYLGNYYIREGNKRVSVLRYFGAVRIPARVVRLLPEKTDPAWPVYQEYLDFFKATGIGDFVFRRPGRYARLLSLTGKKPGEEWTREEARRLASSFGAFREAFHAIGTGEPDILPEEAFLLFLNAYPYAQAVRMAPAEMKKALAGLWSDVRSSSEPDAIAVETAPDDQDKPGVLTRLISAPRHLLAAFICQRTPEVSPWTRGHAEGAAYLAQVLPESVSVRVYDGADTPELAEARIDEAAADGADLIFTTTPPLLNVTLKAAARYPKIRFYNCSACQPFSSVKPYYGRIFEGKFITGMIAGALAENDLVGYIGSYPILGVPAAVNAFALGARMTNPRARILLEWSCTEADCVQRLRERGAAVISNRDIPVPDSDLLKEEYTGTFSFDEAGRPVTVASPVWVWGRLYENIARTVLAGASAKKDQAVNYWWGMDSGVIDVAMTDAVPEGVRALADVFTEKLKQGEYDIFSQTLRAQDGSLISDGITPLSALDILKMDRLADSVEGRIPAYEEIFPMSRALVRELGIYREQIPPEAEE